MATTTDQPVEADRLKRWALRLAYATIAWNVLEAIAAIAAGAAANSVGLVSFGLDSTIEVASALVVVWQFRAGHDEQRERVALRAIAISFFALAAYAATQAIVDLVTRSEPESSVPGIVHRRAVARCHAGAVVGQATGWSPTRLQDRGRRQRADVVVHLPVRGAPHWLGSELGVRVVVGRPARRARRDRSRRHRRTGRVARRGRRLLQPRANMTTPPKAVNSRVRAAWALSRVPGGIADPEPIWVRLAEAHVLSQPFAWLHIRTHACDVAACDTHTGPPRNQGPGHAAGARRARIALGPVPRRQQREVERLDVRTDA